MNPFGKLGQSELCGDIKVKSMKCVDSSKIKVCLNKDYNINTYAITYTSTHDINPVVQLAFGIIKFLRDDAFRKKGHK